MGHRIALNFEDGVRRFVACRPLPRPKQQKSSQTIALLSPNRGGRRAEYAGSCRYTKRSRAMT
jgi:hypothetical protein